jgi:hypothetical protein
MQLILNVFLTGKIGNLISGSLWVRYAGSKKRGFCWTDFPVKNIRILRQFL